MERIDWLDSKQLTSFYWKWHIRQERSHHRSTGEWAWTFEKLSSKPFLRQIWIWPRAASRPAIIRWETQFHKLSKVCNCKALLFALRFTINVWLLISLQFFWMKQLKNHQSQISEINWGSSITHWWDNQWRHRLQAWWEPNLGFSNWANYNCIIFSPLWMSCLRPGSKRMMQQRHRQRITLIMHFWHISSRRFLDTSNCHKHGAPMLKIQKRSSCFSKQLRSSSMSLPNWARIKDRSFSK